MAGIRVETNRRQLVYSYELTQPGEVVLTTETGQEVRLLVRGGSVELRSEFGMALSPESANVVLVTPREAR